MKELLINKELLKDYKSLSITLENCDVYEIAVDDILDIHCVAEPMGKEKNEYHTKDGFIKIASKASQTIECCVLSNGKVGTERDHRLKERLNMCDGCADMTSFSLRDSEKRNIHIYVPYDPLLRVLHNSEIEWSNCPSLEIDDDGNMLIAFGESSKQPKRKDNNYAELIEGWKDAFGDFQPKILKVKAESLSTFGTAQTKNISFYFQFCNKHSKKDVAELVFMDCKNISVEMFFGKMRNCEISMSRMADGRIYVGLDLGIDFTCASIQEYNYYCRRDEE